ncbi:hypothetical protein ACTXOR_09600 [Arthrobacter rhombi]|nr:hypothetical protein [Glutamicibacter sp. BW78]
MAELAVKPPEIGLSGPRGDSYLEDIDIPLWILVPQLLDRE